MFLRCVAPAMRGAGLSVHDEPPEHLPRGGGRRVCVSYFSLDARVFEKFTVIYAQTAWRSLVRTSSVQAHTYICAPSGTVVSNKQETSGGATGHIHIGKGLVRGEICCLQKCVAPHI